MQQKRSEYGTSKDTNFRQAFTNEGGAIDLASIMVGIIVIGLIGGVIAATVFAVIPWSQDNAAKHQLESVASAESAYMGLSSDSPPALPAGHKANSFADSSYLDQAGLLTEGMTYCAITTDEGKGYQGFSKSASGSVWSITDKNTKPSVFTGVLPSDCQFIAEGTVLEDNERIIKTYDFESGINGWECVWTGCSLTVSKDQFHSSPKSLFLNYKKTSSSNWIQTKTSIDGLEAGKTYRAKAWVYVEQGNSPTITLGGKRFGSSEKFAKREWQELASEYTVPETFRGGSTNLTVEMDLPSGQAQFYIDDVRLIEVLPSK